MITQKVANEMMVMGDYNWWGRSHKSGECDGNNIKGDVCLSFSAPPTTQMSGTHTSDLTPRRNILAYLVHLEDLSDFDDIW